MLAIAATFLGCFLIFTLPDWTAAQINKQLPYWVYENEVSSVTLQVANVLWHEEKEWTWHTYASARSRGTHHRMGECVNVVTLLHIVSCQQCIWD